MSRRPNFAETMARKAAAAVEMVEDDEPSEVIAAASEDLRVTGTPNKGRGRPKGKREIDARVTVYLDAARHAALVKIAADRGRSVHSLILEGIDAVTDKPTTKAW
jgi:hypothetical protein